MVQGLSPELQAKRFQRSPWSQEPSIWDPWLAEKGEFEPRRAWAAPTYQYWWPYPFPPPEVPGMPSPSERLGNPEAAARRIEDAVTRGEVTRHSPLALPSEGTPAVGGEAGRGGAGAYGAGAGAGALALLSPLIGSAIGKGVQKVLGGGTQTIPEPQGPFTPFQPDIAFGAPEGGSAVGLSPVEMEQAANVARTDVAASGFEPFIPSPTAGVLEGGSAYGSLEGSAFDPYSGVHAGFEPASTSSSLMGPALATAGTAYGIGQMAAAGEPTYGGMSSAVPGATALGAYATLPAVAGPAAAFMAAPFILGGLTHTLAGGSPSRDPMLDMFDSSALSGDRATGEAILRARPDLGLTMTDWDNLRANYVQRSQEATAYSTQQQALTDFLNLDIRPETRPPAPIPPWWMGDLAGSY